MSDVYQLTDDEIAREPRDDFAKLKESVANMAKSMQQGDSLSQTAQIDASSKYDWRTVQLARHMCVTQGHDPDQMVVDLNSTKAGPFNSVPVHDSVPAWTLYLEAAHAVNEAAQ